MVAVHGITGNHQAWGAVAGALAGAADLVAPDLRGRGASRDLPGPYGMRAHADDVIAVLDHLGLGQAVLVGHSMGGAVVAIAAVRHPERVAALVLVDGGPALPLPSDADPGEVLAATLGPALERLSMTFDSVDAYRDFFHQHPAFAAPGAVNDDVVAYLEHDLVPDGDRFRPAPVPEAVQVDGRELLVDDEVRAATERFDCPATLLRAPRGLFDQVPPLLPDEALADLRSRWRIGDERLVADTNHYTIVFAPHGAAAVAEAVRSHL